MYLSHVTTTARALLLSLVGTTLVLAPSVRAQNTGTISEPPATPSMRLQPIPAAHVISNSVTARSPIEAEITWTDTGSAPGYDVLRNGELVHAVIASERRYVDSNLRPSTRYTYQVRARTSPPTTAISFSGARGPNGEYIAPGFTPLPPPDPNAPPPRVAAPVEVVTPRALAPTGVYVSLRPDGTTRIEWTPRPEARDYVITRNGAPISIPNGPPIVVTSAATSGAYDDRGQPGGTYTYAVQSVLRPSDRSQVLGEPSAPLTIVTRPFNVVAIGDSVMWGQGLADKSKFVTKVRQRLEGQLGKPVSLYLFARSGAEMGLNPYPKQFALGDEGAAVQELASSSGEVPRALPSIMHQALTVAPARVVPADVDLVLMDGCINDVGVMSILDPTASEAAISAKTQQFCGPQTMNARLARVHQTYPNAKILLTGYFPIVSNLSDLTAVAVLMTNVGALSAAVAPLFGVPLDPVTGAIAGAITTQVLRDKAVSHSTVFQTTSTSALATSAMSSNGGLGGNRIRFVAIPFTERNAYAAPETWLWLVPTPGVNLPNAVDEVFDQRFKACSALKSMPPTCIPASMGHPNVPGAQAYADAITNALAEFVPGWTVLHAKVKS